MNANAQIPVPLPNAAVWYKLNSKVATGAYPETVQGTQDWNDTYKVRMYVEDPFSM